MTSIQNHGATGHTGNVTSDMTSHQATAPKSILKDISAYSANGRHPTTTTSNGMRQPLTWGANQVRIFSQQGRWGDTATGRASINHNSAPRPPMRGGDNDAPRLSSDAPRRPTRSTDD